MRNGGGGETTDEGRFLADLQHAGTGQQFFGQQQTALGAAISTPSLSESNASTSLLCKPAKNGLAISNAKQGIIRARMVAGAQ